MYADNIEKLYANYGILVDAKEDILKHEKEYLEILEAVQGSEKEKRLASQFIAKFFPSFPELGARAVDALFDLCEDENVAIRKQAIKDLPSLCKEKEYTRSIIDILIQLLQSEDATEVVIATNSILAVLKSDPAAALKGIFSRIHNDGAGNIDEGIREKCIKFLATNVKALGRDVVTEDAENVIIAECKKVLQDVSAVEFELVMDLLMWTKMGTTDSGKKELVDIISKLAFSLDDWHPEAPEYVSRFLQCCQYAVPLFSTQVDSTKLVKTFCDYVFKQWDAITEDGADSKLELLQVFAQLTQYCANVHIPQTLEAVYKVLMKYLVKIPSESEDSDLNDEVGSSPSVKLSHVECALYALHTLCKKAPEELSSDATRLRSLRLRLQHTAQLAQTFAQKLKENDQGKKNGNSEEETLRVAAVKTISNIVMLTRDVFRSPPRFESEVELAFLVDRKSKTEVPEANNKKESTALQYQKRPQKRHLPITFDGENRKPYPKKTTHFHHWNQKKQTGRFNYNNSFTNMSSNDNSFITNGPKANNFKKFNKNINRFPKNFIKGIGKGFFNKPSFKNNRKSFRK